MIRRLIARIRAGAPRATAHYAVWARGGNQL